MRSCREMRHDAWDIMKGRWFWRLLVGFMLLQLVSPIVGALLSGAYEALSITTVADYVAAKVNAARQGLSYSLPTAKAYCWMACGFAFQIFITYIFAAIMAFWFMGLLLKARANDNARWLSDALVGFARPLEVAWLLLLMNLCVLLAAVPGFLIGGAAAVALVACCDIQASLNVGIAVAFAVALLGVVFALRAVYAYRQAWFIKNESPDASAFSCLRESRRMMKGRKMLAFALDLSYLGWFIMAMLLYMASAVFGALLSHLGVAAAVLSFCFGAACFYVMVKTIIGSFVARAVFYRDLQSDLRSESAGGTAESEA